jgi:uncharacterized protein YdiU (UPF0061 family)
LAVAGGLHNVWRKGIKQKQGMITRFAPTWIRFGSFELFFYKKDQNKLKELADFLIDFHFPDAKNGQLIETRSLLSASIFKTEQVTIGGGAVNHMNPKDFKKEPKNIHLNKYGALFRLVVRKTAVMVASWQAEGFVHGLLNTDHMSIMGLTMHTSHGV